MVLIIIMTHTAITQGQKIPINRIVMKHATSNFTIMLLVMPQWLISYVASNFIELRILAQTRHYVVVDRLLS